MANPRRSDAARLEDCDWSFLDRPEVMEGLDKVARKAAARGDFDYEDLRQDLYLWLGVRPGVQAKPDHLVVLDLRHAVQVMASTVRSRAEAIEWLPLEEVE